jgi:hypothetical protein
MTIIVLRFIGDNGGQNSYRESDLTLIKVKKGEVKEVC